jgi:hypothetical protein
MTKKWIAITLLLFLVTALLGWQLYVSVKNFNAENDLSKIQPVPDIKQKILQDKPLPRSAQPVRRTAAEYSVIPDRNVFSESRSRSEDSTDGAASTDEPPLTPKPILVGTSIVDNQKRASIIDPTSSSQGRNRRSQIKRIGDVYRGYTITDITPNGIVLENGSRREIIPLHEGSKGQQSGKTPIVSTRVVSIGGGATTGSIPVFIAGGASPAPVRTGTPAAPPSASATPPRVQPVVAVPGAAPQRTTSNVTPATQTTLPQTQTIETDAQGRRIIRTPFGNIVRPNRE